MPPCWHGLDKHSFTSVHTGRSVWPSARRAVPLASQAKVADGPAYPRAQLMLQVWPTCPRMQSLASRVAAVPEGGRQTSVALALHVLHNLAHLRIENAFFRHNSRSVAGCDARLLLLQVPYLDFQEGSS